MMNIAHRKQCSDIISGILRGVLEGLKQLNSFIGFLSCVFFSKLNCKEISKIVGSLMD